MSRPRTTSGASHLRTNGVTTADLTARRPARHPIDRRIIRALLTLAVWLLVAAPALAQNQPPVADAGPDQSALTDEVVELHGSATDPDGDPIVS